MCSCFPSASKCKSSSPNTCGSDSPLIAGDGAARLRETRRGASAGVFAGLVLRDSFFVMLSLAPMSRESDQRKDWKVPLSGGKYPHRFPVRGDCFLLSPEFPGSAVAAKEA